MMEGSAYLIKQTYEVDEIGQRIPAESKREILCHIEYVGQKEFFSAGQNGFKATIKVITPAVNYENEQIIEIDGERYSIYRPYRRASSDEIELYCEWKGGTDGEAES